ncbi:MAG: C25 family cysteine peptidase [Chthoniobacterales bacterium]
MWLPSDPRNPAASNSPIVVDVTVATTTNTEVEVSIPGLWVEPVTYGSNSSPFMRLRLPPIEIKGIGHPQNRGERGWWDFPAALKQPLRNPAAFTRANGGIKQYDIPSSVVGANPTTAAEMERLGINPAGARPGLPFLRVPVALSRSNTNSPSSLEAFIATTNQPASFALPFPVAPAGFTGMDAASPMGGYRAPQLIDGGFYAQSNFTNFYSGTEALLGPVETIAGPMRGAWLSIPVASLASPTNLTVIPKFKIYLKHLAGTEDFECDIPADLIGLMPPFLNGAAMLGSLSLKGLDIEASRSAHYLIMCPRDWRPVLEEFAQWKAAKGLNVDFVYVGADGDIPDNRVEIDNYLESYFVTNYCHGVYVLICGENNVIAPGRAWSRITGDPDESNADSDHVYEVLGPDRHASMFVGRLSANTTNELKLQLDKILRYEKSPFVGDWPLYFAMCANSETDSGARGISPEWPSKYARAVQDAVNYAGYTNPPGFITLHAGASSFLQPRAANIDVVNTLNDGIGQLLYRGHGNEEAWGAGWDGASDDGNAWVSTNIVNMLTNRVHPIVYSISCLNSRINQEDSIAEMWMSQPGGGAVAHFGATVTSYTAENHERCKAIARVIYELGYTRLGPALAAAESLSFATTGGGGGWTNNTFCYMLLGDPEMEIRKAAVPVRSTNIVLRPTIVTNGTTKVRVTDASGAAKPGAFVNILLNDGSRTNGYANTDGDVPLGFDPGLIARIDLLLDGAPVGTEYRKTPVLRAEGFATSPTGGPGGFKVRLVDAPQGLFRIHATTNLLGTNWTDLGESWPAGTDQEFTDATASPISSLRRFYRAVQQP